MLRAYPILPIVPNMFGMMYVFEYGPEHTKLGFHKLFQSFPIASFARLRGLRAASLSQLVCKTTMSKEILAQISQIYREVENTSSHSYVHMGVGNAAIADTISGASAGRNPHGIMGAIYLAVSSKEFHPRKAHEIGKRPHLPQPGKVAKRKRFTNPSPSLFLLVLIVL